MAGVDAQWCVSIEYRDAKGQTRKVTICWFANGVASNNLAADFFGATAAVVPLLQACSNAHVTSQGNPLGANGEYRGYYWGATGEYQSVAQQAVLSYLTLDDANNPQGIVGRLTIPAPKASIFLADGVTVDPANAAIVALNAQIITALPVSNAAGACTRSGLVFTTFLGGVFVGRKLSRKMNRFTYNAELTVRGV